MAIAVLVYYSTPASPVRMTSFIHSLT